MCDVVEVLLLKQLFLVFQVSNSTMDVCGIGHVISTFAASTRGGSVTGTTMRNDIVFCLLSAHQEKDLG